MSISLFLSSGSERSQGGGHGKSRSGRQFGATEEPVQDLAHSTGNSRRTVKGAGSWVADLLDSVSAEEVGTQLTALHASLELERHSRFVLVVQDVGRRNETNVDRCAAETFIASSGILTLDEVVESRVGLRGKALGLV